ncbi:hypothetical protein [Evansella clarkii]|uniref:hypothetical protein n=1 Tax=Evansella clarkii TaxID=79879 RepID=UPI0009971012|nr:hypothetical protein [Evansella clarkii]
MTYNTYIYISLAFLASLLFLCTLAKQKDFRIILLYFIMAGHTFLFEYVIFTLLDSYVYYPKILQNPFYDSIMGAIVSNGFVIPMVSVSMAAFYVSWKNRFLTAFYIMAIEVLFLSLGIYEHNWYRTIYTGFGVLGAFLIADFWHSTLRGKPGRLARFFSLFIPAYTFKASAQFFASGVFNKFIYTAGWFENPYRDSIAYATPSAIFCSLILAYTFTYYKRWAVLLLSLIFLCLTDYLQYYFGFIQLYDWSLWMYFLLTPAALAFIWLLDAILSAGDSFFRCQPSPEKLIHSPFPIIDILYM